MKLPIRLLTIVAFCLGSTHIFGQEKQQPVVAYKEISNSADKNKEWTIGIYDANDQLVSEKVVFKNNTSFVAGKGKKLFFDWEKSPNFIYVAKLNAGNGKKGTDIPRRFNLQKDNPSLFDMLKSKEITPEKAPVGSKIKITDLEITIEPPKEETRTITVYALNETAPDMPLKVQAVKKGAEPSVAENLYGKRITITKPGKTYKLTIPKDKDFDVLLMPKPRKGFPVSISKAGIGKDTELAIGQNTIVGKQKSDRAQVLKDDKKPA